MKRGWYDCRTRREENSQLTASHPVNGTHMASRLNKTTIPLAQTLLVQPGSTVRHRFSQFVVLAKVIVIGTGHFAQGGLP